MTIQDTRNFLSKLTPKKIWNAGKIIASYYRTKYTRRPGVWGLPFTISVEPTTSCNLGCPECPSGLRSFSRPTGQLDLDLFEKIIDKNQHTLVWLYLYFQGEPFMHPKFTEIVHYASSRNIYTVTSTNAHFLTSRKAKEVVKSTLDRIIVSIDGATQETYESYRKGGSLQKAIEGTRNLVEWKKKLRSSTPHIILQCLIVRPNEHQIEEIKALGKDLGVDEVVFKTAQIYDYKQGNDLIPQQEAYSRYKRQPDGTYRIKSKWHNHCWKMWHSCVITWDGNVVPCAFDKDAQYVFGNASEKSLQEIWNNELYMDFRNRLLTSRKEIDICRNCTEGLEVWKST